MYRVTVDRTKRLIRFEIIGYLESDELSRMNEDIRARALQLRAGGPHFSMLVDLRKTVVVAQNDTALVSEQMKWMVDNGMQKAASLVASVLQKMQVDRMAANPAIRCFTSEQEALDWLAT